ARHPGRWLRGPSSPVAPVAVRRDGAVVTPVAPAQVVVGVVVGAAAVVVVGEDADPAVGPALRGVRAR
ncbi:hypothetical protein, partial [Kytococcus sp. HMSC28H12]|uniref:hypothetical protein n=1 Tax=Kytococcus sp. HMSC28H12 TaxID=1581067 RepID=UPI000AE32F4C